MATQRTDSNLCIMKIGIVTQPLLNNYGGVLQNFALQQTLRKLGHEPITIDYTPQMTRGRFVKLWVRGLFYNLFHTTKRELLKSRVTHRRHRYFAEFIEKNISTTRCVHKYSPRLVTEYQLEAVITGSDQVWRPCYNRRVLTNMFLDFVPGGSGAKKIAYAASFGVDNWEYKPSNERKCRKLAQRLDAVSVRESSGVALCSDYLHIEATEVLDPTLLLAADDYKAVCANVPKSEDRYVAAYILDATPEKVEYVKQEAERRGVSYRIYGAGSDVSLSVEEWLALFRDAESVVTDSFHGCAFSTIFRKDFVAIINRDRGASRFVSLLGKFDMLDRVIIDSTCGELPTESVKWDRIEEILKSWQAHSLNYLSKNLCR